MKNKFIFSGQFKIHTDCPNHLTVSISSLLFQLPTELALIRCRGFRRKTAGLPRLGAEDSEGRLEPAKCWRFSWKIIETPKMRTWGFRRNRSEDACLEHEVYEDIGGETHYLTDLNTSTRGWKLESRVSFRSLKHCYLNMSSRGWKLESRISFQEFTPLLRHSPLSANGLLGGW